MQTAQLMHPYELRTVTGDPVAISSAPPGARFLLCTVPNGRPGVFSIDTGCWISDGETRVMAIANAIALFDIKMTRPTFIPYWFAACSLMDAYRLWTWHAAAARHYFPGHKPLSSCPAGAMFAFPEGL